MKYENIQDIIDSVERKQIISQLKEHEIKHHFNEKLESLAEKLFKFYNEGSIIDDKPVKEVKENPSRWAEIADAIKEESKNNFKSNSTPKNLQFISKDYNFNLSPRGTNKRGKNMRYVKGLSTLEIVEQRMQADVFPQEWIHFKGVNTPLKMNNFEGRGVISVSDITLQKYILDHKTYGSEFVLYDEAEKNRRDLEEDRKITLTKSEMYKASEDDLISTISFIGLSEGNASNFEQMRLFDMNKLRKTCLNYIHNDIDGFLSAMKNPRARLIHLVHLARERGIIKVSSDERSITLKSGGAVLAASSVATNWQDDLIEWLMTEEGRTLATKLEMQCNYYIR